MPDHRRDAGRCLIVGILNVTPDSFSDGGRHDGPADAVRHGLRMTADGADVVDVGGESTRPGAGRVPVEVELARVLPVVSQLAEAGVAVSIDTTRRVVAQAAVERGAVLVNDVSGGRADPDMHRFVADAGVGYVLMHSRGTSVDMRARARYRDVVGEVCAELAASTRRAVRAGIDPSRIVLDPGLGFAKRPEHDWRLLAGLPRLRALGYQVLVGASRKSFLAAELARPTTPAERDAATAAVTALAVAEGAWGVRVHEVRASVDAAAVGAAAARPGARHPTAAVVGPRTDRSRPVTRFAGHQL